MKIVKTCEYYLKSGYWHTGCAGIVNTRSIYCSKCGGEIFVKQTTEKKLEAAERLLKAEQEYGIYWRDRAERLGGIGEKLESANKHLFELVKFINRLPLYLYAPGAVEEAQAYIEENGLSK